MIQDYQINENTFSLLGRSDVEDINKKFKLHLPDSDEYETVAGLLLFYHEDIPKKDDTIELEDYRFTILNVNKTTILEVKLEVLSLK